MKEISRLFNLKKPCRDCPFIKGGYVLAPGRLESIKEGLRTEAVFFCHKTIDHSKDNENYDHNGENYRWSGSESYCAGAIAWQIRNGIIPQTLIAGQVYGYADIGEAVKKSKLVELKDDNEA